MKPILPWILGAAAVAFGVVTLVVGGSVLLDIGSARADHGEYVPFVLWFNVLAGFAYVAAGIGLALRRRWAGLVAVVIAAGTAITTLALGGHILSGGAFERETVMAMGVRFVFWTGISIFAFLSHRRGPSPAPPESTP